MDFYSRNPLPLNEIEKNENSQVQSLEAAEYLNKVVEFDKNACLTTKEQQGSSSQKLQSADVNAVTQDVTLHSTLEEKNPGTKNVSKCVPQIQGQKQDNLEQGPWICRLPMIQKFQKTDPFISQLRNFLENKE